MRYVQYMNAVRVLGGVRVLKTYHLELINVDSRNKNIKIEKDN